MPKKEKFKNSVLMIFYAFLIGCIIGIIVWTFIRIMNLGIYFLWTYIPSKISFKLYPFIICIIGGLLIGITHKKYGVYPLELTTVIKDLKINKQVSYENLPILVCIALIPIIFGGSIGPEAGLSCIIISLSCWAKDKFKFLGENLQELCNMGTSATLGIIFNSPLFGFISPFEESSSDNTETTFPKSSKTIVYFACILGALAIYSFLGNLLGKSSGMPRFNKITIEKSEYIFLLPISIISSICGVLFYIFRDFSKKVLTPLKDKLIIKAILCSILLSILFITLPITLFSGENQIEILIKNYSNMTILILFLGGVVKLFITNFCIESGWMGGHIFPVIFSGVSIGYALGLLFSINPIFSVTISTASICGVIMRKPLAVSLLLMLCFPLKAILWILVAALIGSYFPLPKKFI